MKKSYIYFLVFIVFLLGSCNDAIDITQPGRLSAENAFRSVDDLKLGIFSAYNSVDVTADIRFAASFTDELSIGFDNGGQRANYLFALNSTTGAPGTVWINQYGTINSATRIIEASSLVTPDPDDPVETEEYNHILGQAHALRAYAHFQLFSYFTTDYQNDNALCVIGVDFVPALTDEFPRNTVGEVIALINSDLDEALSLLNDDTSDPTFINKDFVTALRARLAAYRGEYSTAASLAKSLTDKYSLANRTQYVDVFQDEDNTEVIFKLERTVGDSYDGQGTGGGGWAGSLFAFINATITGSPYFEMSRSLFNQLDPADIRYTVIVEPTSIIDPDYATSPDVQNSDILIIGKYAGSEGQPLMNDLKIFRASEMVLIEAEAAAASGDLGGAANFIKEIRDARFGTAQAAPNFSSQEDAFGVILDERRLELAFEGHRYLDLKRLRNSGNREIDRDAADCERFMSCTLENDDHKWTFPIPEVELNANSVIRDQQNPGY